FGGYWAWDPVETANLLAWFPLLLLVHALLYYRKRRMFAAAAPLFAVLTLVADLFSTFATRTGLWVSVHAFTDPSRSFASDPLVRLLNILDTSPILRWLGAMLLASIFVALAAYFKRIHDDALEARTHARAAPMTARIGIGILAALSLVAFLDVTFVFSAVFEVAHRITFGNAALGLGVLAFGAALVFASPGLSNKEEPPPAEPRPFWDRYIATPQLVFLGVVLLSLAFLVTFLLQVLSVNGYNRVVYEQRAPIVALPILLVMPAALTHQVFGKRRVVEISAAAGLLGVFMALIGTQMWEVLLVLPALLWAIVGTSVKLYKVSDHGGLTPSELRIAGGLLLFGGILNMVYWSNPPTRIPLGFTDVHPTAWWAPVGFLLGLAATLSSIGVLRAKTVRAHRYGAVFLFLGVGFLITPILAPIVLWLGERRRNAFPDAQKAMPILTCAAGVRREIRKTGVYLMHVAIVLGLLGIALSTYQQAPETEIEIAQGEMVHMHGYTFTLVGSRATDFDPEIGAFREVSALVEVRRGREVLDLAPLTMWWELPSHYAERVRVERFADEDVYLRPVEFVTPERTFLAHEDNVELTSGRVDAVTFTVRTLPGMHLVWAGLWMVAAGMLVNLAAGGARFEAGRAAGSAGLRDRGVD
ncbi:MAG TPA: cytochrome c biogenesis protein CcsA, partial [Candidatus Thermoplasmatota archaeon]|nr:cytochrome c biogenesis protein CcsA [Candidatus Thermoplasmatota archaeon]